MARDHFIAPTAPTADAIAVRLGAGSGSSNNLTTAEVGKFAKLVAESRYNLCAVGNEIEAVIFSVELAPQNQFTVGGVVEEGTLNVTFDGLEQLEGLEPPRSTDGARARRRGARRGVGDRRRLGRGLRRPGR